MRYQTPPSGSSRQLSLSFFFISSLILLVTPVIESVLYDVFLYVVKPSWTWTSVFFTLALCYFRLSINCGWTRLNFLRSSPKNVFFVNIKTCLTHPLVWSILCKTVLFYRGAFYIYYLLYRIKKTHLKWSYQNYLSLMYTLHKLISIKYD